MCGILGRWTAAARSLPPFALGLEALRHRGPDDVGHATFTHPAGSLELGHTRLSIIDISAGGHQPMYSADGRYSIVFNGEIYNYLELRAELERQGLSFRSDSDTEVLLACWKSWGEAAIPRLRGMFAFTIHDQERQHLTCVRDAFGIKPLFYRATPDVFCFSSEIPALLKLLPERPLLNIQRAHDYLVGGYYDDSEQSFFHGVLQLRPGHLLRLDLNRRVQPELARWWWPSIAERSGLGFADAAEKLRTMFLDNIRLHLRSDVPLAAALSGGIDSSAVVCAIRHVAPAMPIHTFSYVARDSDVNEECWTDLVNQHVGAIAHKVVVAPQELADDLDDMIRSQGEPFGSTSIYAQYRVYRQAREAGITVTLDGQGADELLAGYFGYPGARMRSLAERHECLELLRFTANWPRWPGRSRLEAMLMCVALLLPQNAKNMARRLIGREAQPGWVNMDWLANAGVARFAPANIEFGDDEAGRRLMATLRQTLSGRGLNSLLRHGDRNSMRWSIESRVPFLTTDLAEFLLTLPEHYLISPQGETKSVFRAAMRGIVPDAILDRRDKIGFATPERTWLQELQQPVEQWLQAADALPFLDTDKCRHAIRAMIDGQVAFSFQAWRLINFCRWTQLFDLQTPV